MTLTQMRYFYEVCKWRSITKAAASLHISQPTVSIAMADLEKESGLNLFRREGKKLSLTEDGSLLLMILVSFHPSSKKKTADKATIIIVFI